MTKQPKPLKSMPEIAERLALIRRASKLSQAAWCRFVGIEPTAWNNYEVGERRISVDQAMKISRATGVTLDYIYQGSMAAMPIEFATELQRLRDIESKPGAAAPRARKVLSSILV